MSMTTPEAAPTPTPERSGSPYSTMLAILAGGVSLALIVLAIGSVRKDDSTGDLTQGGGNSTLPVTLSEFKIEGALTAPPGQVTFEMKNAGSMVHNLKIEGKDGQSADIGGGQSGTYTVKGLAAGEYNLFCAIPGHKDSGMATRLRIAAGAEVNAASESQTSGGSHSNEPTLDEGAKMDASMLASFKPFVDQIKDANGDGVPDTIIPNTKGKGNVPMEPKVLADGTKQFDLTIEIIDWEVEPGKIVRAWAYNEQVPGPLIRVNVGDKVKMRLTNKLPVATDVHNHGLLLPNSQDGVAPVTQDVIRPGETYDYDFVAEAPAIAMYHPHIHGQTALPNGAFGVFIVGDTPIPYGRTVSGVTIPKDVKPALEIPMVLNDAGTIGLTLNGKSFPATEPYAVPEGSWIVAHYYNEGMQIHPMHQHQFPQLVFARDGIPLDQPYFADTVTVAPGERVSVMFQANRKGVWAWHCHILNHAEAAERMFGMVTAVAVL